MAVLMTLEAQTSSHMVGMCLLIKTIYIHHIIVPFLRSGLGMIVSVSVGVGKGDSGVLSVDVSINFHDSSEILIEIIGDIFGDIFGGKAFDAASIINLESTMLADVLADKDLAPAVLENTITLVPASTFIPEKVLTKADWDMT